MRVMADRTVLLHRLVVADEGSAFFHVAGIAGVVDAIAHHHAWTGRAMRIMAIGAGDLAFSDRMAGRPVDLVPLLLMASEAHFRLRQLVANSVMGGMHLVTGGAGRILVRMAAARPVDAFAALMAGQAGLALLIGRVRRIFSE